MKREILIRGVGAVSALGHTTQAALRGYKSGKSHISVMRVGTSLLACYTLAPAAENVLGEISQEKYPFSSLDRSSLMALYASREAVAEAGWGTEEKATVGVSIGSARGATGTLERRFKDFLESGEERCHPSVSPTTTAGNISSTVACELSLSGISIGQSMTCTSSSVSLATGFAFIQSKMADRFLAGGAEAPLTPFTLAQAKAMKLYSEDTESAVPCRPCSSEQNRKNSLVLGEGACVLALEASDTCTLPKKTIQALPRVLGIGFGHEAHERSTSISQQGEAFQIAMKQAMCCLSPDRKIDAVALHCPGTLQGDAAEVAALHAIFGQDLPAIFSTKCLLGHTYGASGSLSIQYALLLLSQRLPPCTFPYPSWPQGKQGLAVKTVLVNAAGFGGNAVSIIVGAGA